MVYVEAKRKYKVYFLRFGQCCMYRLASWARTEGVYVDNELGVFTGVLARFSCDLLDGG